MEKFPVLKGSQVALVRADTYTGHVLDVNCNVAISDSQKVFTVIESVEAALDFAKGIIFEKKTIECVIYSAEDSPQYFLDLNLIDNPKQLR